MDTTWGIKQVFVSEKKVHLMYNLQKSVFIDYPGVHHFKNLFFFFFLYFEYLPWADFLVLYKVSVFRSTQHLQIIYFQYLNIRWRNDLYVIHIFVILMCGYC